LHPRKSPSQNTPFPFRLQQDASTSVDSGRQVAGTQHWGNMPFGVLSRLDFSELTDHCISVRGIQLAPVTGVL
jgi:hypothetical protein